VLTCNTKQCLGEATNCGQSCQDIVYQAKSDPYYYALRGRFFLSRKQKAQALDAVERTKSPVHLEQWDHKGTAGHRCKLLGFYILSFARWAQKGPDVHTLDDSEDVSILPPEVVDIRLLLVAKSLLGAMIALRCQMLYVQETSSVSANEDEQKKHMLKHQDILCAKVKPKVCPEHFNWSIHVS